MNRPDDQRPLETLIVERDSHQAAVACAMVEATGGTATWTNDAAMALQLIETRKFQLGWASLEEDGLRVLRRVRFRQPDAWRVLTGDGRRWELVAAALRHGDVQRFLRKPLDPVSMLTMMRQVATQCAA